jgi:hypothetical protein
MRIEVLTGVDRVPVPEHLIHFISVVCMCMCKGSSLLTDILQPPIMSSMSPMSWSVAAGMAAELAMVLISIDFVLGISMFLFVAFAVVGSVESRGCSNPSTGVVKTVQKAWKYGSTIDEIGFVDLW